MRLAIFSTLGLNLVWTWISKFFQALGIDSQLLADIERHISIVTLATRKVTVIADVYPIHLFKYAIVACFVSLCKLYKGKLTF